ncbi:MAG TPA: flagellar hook-length control protein FliK, partial [Caldimonas sp.]|nr:flagellar hook-length control protein FliK [Caldimonas sp.]
SVDAGDGRRTAIADATRDGATGPAADARFQAALAETSFDAAGPARAHEPAIDPSTASLGIAAPVRQGEPASAAAPSQALALPTPIDAPDFATALGVRVSVLVQDGVQQAELHLNPAETGPVSIHITLDGSAARVDFGADVAATRAAIERGLPELASALRDAGFTLAGGGVSQHAGGRASDDGSARASARPPAGSDAAATSIGNRSRAVARIVPAGGIDLYA